MYNIPLFIENHKNGVAEAGRVAESFEHFFALFYLGLVGLPWVVVDVQEHEVVFNQFVDSAVVRHEVGEFEAPGAPVAANLADDELT